MGKSFCFLGYTKLFKKRERERERESEREGEHLKGHGTKCVCSYFGLLSMSIMCYDLIKRSVSVSTVMQVLVFYLTLYCKKTPQLTALYCVSEPSRQRQ